MNVAYHPADNDGYGVKSGFVPVCYRPVDPPEGFGNGIDTGRTLGNRWGGADLEFIAACAFHIPFFVCWRGLAGDGGLTSGNNLTLKTVTALTPVSLHNDFILQWTPLAFMTLECGFLLGTGWNLENAGIYGMGLNSDGTGNISLPGFGLVLKERAGINLQFDLAAVWPGEWRHILLFASFSFVRQDYTSAGKNEAWLWRNDYGENFNGWQYRGTYFAGYKFPFNELTAGMLIETFENLGSVRKLSTLDSEGWGSDFADVTFGPTVSWKGKYSQKFTIVMQFRTIRDYEGDTIFYNWFQNRESSGTVSVRFYRIAFSYSYNF